MIDLVLCASARDEVRIVHELANTPALGIRVVRRCADLAETRGAVAAGIGDAVLIDLSVRGLDREVLTELARGDRAVVGLRDPEITASETSLGMARVVEVDAPIETIARMLRDGVEKRGESPTVSDDDWTQPPVPALGARMVAVWGPQGAPGRSTIALNLAAEAAAEGVQTTLVDADTHAPALVQMLGILEEAPGLVAACRAASRGTLTPEILDGLLSGVGEHLEVLTGIGVPARWAEAGEASLEVVWRALRGRGGLIVVDTAAPLAQDEDLTYDTVAPQRNAATLSVLREADAILAVTSADPVSLTRLVRERESLADVTHAPVHVIINRHSEAVSEARLHSLLAERFPCASIQVLPEDARTVWRALWEGAALRETAPRSPIRRALREIALSAPLSEGLAVVGD